MALIWSVVSLITWSVVSAEICTEDKPAICVVVIFSRSAVSMAAICAVVRFSTWVTVSTGT